MAAVVSRPPARVAQQVGGGSKGPEPGRGRRVIRAGIGVGTLHRPAGGTGNVLLGRAGAHPEYLVGVAGVPLASAILHPRGAAVPAKGTGPCRAAVLRQRWPQAP